MFTVRHALFERFRADAGCLVNGDQEGIKTLMGLAALTPRESANGMPHGRAFGRLEHQLDRQTVTLYLSEFRQIRTSDR